MTGKHQKHCWNSRLRGCFSNVFDVFLSFFENSWKFQDFPWFFILRYDSRLRSCHGCGSSQPKTGKTVFFMHFLETRRKICTYSTFLLRKPTNLLKKHRFAAGRQQIDVFSASLLVFAVNFALVEAICNTTTFSKCKKWKKFFFWREKKFFPPTSFSIYAKSTRKSKKVWKIARDARFFTLFLIFLLILHISLTIYLSFFFKKIK